MEEPKRPPGAFASYDPTTICNGNGQGEKALHMKSERSSNTTDSKDTKEDMMEWKFSKQESPIEDVYMEKEEGNSASPMEGEKEEAKDEEKSNHNEKSQEKKKRAPLLVPETEENWYDSFVPTKTAPTPSRPSFLSLYSPYPDAKKKKTTKKGRGKRTKEKQNTHNQQKDDR